jgi:AraC-like DNA-binding protein
MTFARARAMTEPKLNAPPDAIARFEMRPVAPALHDAVSQFWLVRLDPGARTLVPRDLNRRALVVLGPDGLGDATAPGFPTGYRHQIVVPDGMLDILVHLPYRTSRDAPVPAESGRPYACVLLPVSRTLNIAFQIPSFILIIRFRPGAARDFLPVSVHTLADRATPLEDLWGATAEDFVDEASREIEITELVAIAERHLLAHMRAPGDATAVVRRCVDALERAHGGLSLDDLREVGGLTERQLERLFKEYVGISPKRLSRILRLDYLVSAVRNLDAVDWHDLIVMLNYCDQPHLIREFKDFIGMSPASFRKEMEQHLERKRRMGENGSSDDRP